MIWPAEIEAARDRDVGARADEAKTILTEIDLTRLSRPEDQNVVAHLRDVYHPKANPNATKTLRDLPLMYFMRLAALYHAQRQPQEVTV